MSRVYSFHGGVHPPENKRQSLGAPIRQAPLPSRLILPLQQHIGKAATPLVEVGQTVLKGQKIAEPNGHISAAIHAPSSGTIAYIGLQPVPHASGWNRLASSLKLMVRIAGSNANCYRITAASVKKT